MTTTPTGSPSAEGNGEHSPPLCSDCPAKSRLALVSTRPNFSPAPLAPPQTGKPLSPVALVPPEAVRDELRDEADALYDRCRQRQKRGGYSFGWRCYSCHLFIGGKHQTCSHCGYMHGGGNHDAINSR